MRGMQMTHRWTDDEGQPTVKVEDMVHFDTLPKLLDQLPLLKTMLQKVETVNKKGKKTTALMATHSLTDVTRRLLQLVPLDLLVFHAKQGKTRWEFEHVFFICSFV